MKSIIWVKKMCYTTLLIIIVINMISCQKASYELKEVDSDIELEEDKEDKEEISKGEVSLEDAVIAKFENIYSTESLPNEEWKIIQEDSSTTINTPYSHAKLILSKKVEKDSTVTLFDNGLFEDNANNKADLLYDYEGTILKRSTDMDVFDAKEFLYVCCDNKILCYNLIGQMYSEFKENKTENELEHRLSFNSKGEGYIMSTGFAQQFFCYFGPIGTYYEFGIDKNDKIVHNDRIFISRKDQVTYYYDEEKLELLSLLKPAVNDECYLVDGDIWYTYAVNEESNGVASLIYQFYNKSNLIGQLAFTNKEATVLEHSISFDLINFNDISYYTGDGLFVNDCYRGILIDELTQTIKMYGFTEDSITLVAEFTNATYNKGDNSIQSNQGNGYLYPDGTLNPDLRYGSEHKIESYFKGGNGNFSYDGTSILRNLDDGTTYECKDAVYASMENSVVYIYYIDDYAIYRLNTVTKEKDKIGNIGSSYDKTGLYNKNVYAPNIAYYKYNKDSNETQLFLFNLITGKEEKVLKLEGNVHIERLTREGYVLMSTQGKEENLIYYLVKLQ